MRYQCRWWGFAFRAWLAEDPGKLVRMEVRVLKNAEKQKRDVDTPMAWNG